MHVKSTRLVKVLPAPLQVFGSLGPEAAEKRRLALSAFVAEAAALSDPAAKQVPPLYRIAKKRELFPTWPPTPNFPLPISKC